MSYQPHACEKPLPTDSGVQCAQKLLANQERGERTPPKLVTRVEKLQGGRSRVSVDSGVLSREDQ